MHDYQDDKLISEAVLIRLFRNGLGIRFENPIHERPVITEGRGLETDIVIRHFGYALSKAQMQSKFERNHRILKNLLEKDPGDPFALYYMAVTLFNHDLESCIRWGEKLLQEFVPGKSFPLFYMNIFYVLAAAHMRCGNLEEAERVCQRAIEVFPACVDAYWTLVDIAFRTGRFDMVVNHGSNYFEHLGHYLKNRGKFPGLIVYSIDKGPEIHLMMALAHLHFGKTRKAKMHIHPLLGKSLLPAGSVDRIQAFLDEWDVPADMQIPLLALLADMCPGEFPENPFAELLLSRFMELPEDEDFRKPNKALSLISCDSDLLLKVAGVLYREDLDTHLWTLLRCTCDLSAELHLFRIIPLMDEGEIEAAIMELDTFLKQSGTPIDRNLETLGDVAELFEECAHKIHVSGDVEKAAILHEAAFQVSPRTNILKHLLSCLQEIGAIRRIRKFILIGARLGLLEREDISELYRRMENRLQTSLEESPVSSSETHRNLLLH